MKKIIIIIILSLCIIISMFLYNLKNADLLTSTSSCGFFVGSCSKTYYIINSKNGIKIHIPSKWLGLISGENEKELEYNEMWDPYKEWEDNIIQLNPDFASHIEIFGQLDENTVIFAIRNQKTWGQDIYKYDINTNKYKFLMYYRNLQSCVAGKGKIFCTVSVVSEGAARDLKDAIYEYDIDMNKKAKIGVYKTGTSSISLEKVLK